MTIRQVFYTSCREGLDGIQGFQVNAVTPGIDRRHIDDGVRLSLYRTPPSAPALPTAAEIAQLPVSVGYRSYSDHALLFHSRYVGADISGRQGNYFAHILVLDDPDRDLRGALPVFAWGGDRWQWQPSATPELPLLPDVPRGGLGAWAVGDHIRSGGSADLCAVLSAVQHGLARGSGRVVVVAPGPQDVARAIVGVCRSLPPALAAEVSFTTFTAAPGDVDVLVAGTTPDVPIPSDPFGGQQVIRLGDGSAADVSRYAQVVAACWARGDDELGKAVELAASLSPLVSAAELDELSYLVELVVPDGSDRVPGAVPLEGLEFGVRRAPRLVTPRIWQRVDQLVAGRPLADVTRWSAVLTAARGEGMRPLPGLEAAYVRSALTALTDTGVDPKTIWLPRRFEGHWEEAALRWAADRLADEPTFATSTAVLTTLGRVGLSLPDRTLRGIVDEVVLPQLIDSSTAAGVVGELERLPATERLLPLVCAQLETRLDTDELFDTVVEELPPEAAELLTPHARRGGRCAFAFATVLARARRGERTPDHVLAEALRAAPQATSDTVSRFVHLLWPDLPPSAGEALAICQIAGPRLLAATNLPERLAERLDIDAVDGGIDLVHADLADALGRDPLWGRLGASKPVVDAICFGSDFRSGPRYSDEVVDRALAAVRRAGDVRPEIRRWVHDGITSWLFHGLGPVEHYDVLCLLLSEESSGAFLASYKQGLITVLRDRPAADIAAVLPPLAALAARFPQARDLLDRTAAMVLTGRPKRDLESVTRAIGRSERRLRPLLGEMGSKGPRTFAQWWDEWHQRHLGNSLMRRLIARRRTARAVD